MANEYQGRRESIGFGIEATAGTAVAPQYWFPHLQFNVRDNPTKVNNTSALGRVEQVNDSAVDTTHAEGTVNGKVGANGIGFFLLNAFGKVTTSDNADSDTSVKDHLFEVSNSSIAPTLTLAAVNPVVSRRYAMTTFSEVEISAAVGDWVKVNAAAMARAGVDQETADVASYADDDEFLTKNMLVKLATNLAGLSGATGIAAKSFKIKVTQGAEGYWTSKTGGSDDASQVRVFTRSGWTATGEIVLRYTSSDYEELYFDNTRQALEVSFNSDKTIGSAAHSTLTFTAPQVTLNTFDKTDDLDAIVEQTIGFQCELSTSEAYALKSLLTNTHSGYAAA